MPLTMHRSSPFRNSALRRHKPLPSLEELEAKYKQDPASLTFEEERRLIRQWNRKRIKDRNASIGM